MQTLAAVFLAGSLLPWAIMALTVVRELGTHFAAMMVSKQAMTALVATLAVSWGGTWVVKRKDSIRVFCVTRPRCKQRQGAMMTMTEPRRRPTQRRGRPMRGRRCERCADRRPVDYKDTEFLYRFIEPTGKLLPSRKTGRSASCQRRIALAVKRARYLALMPYVPAHVRLSGGGKNGHATRGE